MKTKHYIILIFFIASAVIMNACRKNSVKTNGDLQPKQDVFAENYAITYSSKTYPFSRHNTFTNGYAAIGRLLFYDPRLSLSGSVSCASCHNQTLGFADDKPGSIGILQQPTSFNSIAICNTENSSFLFWRGRANNLNQLSLMPVKNHIEMGFIDQDDILRRISSIKLYTDAFVKVNGAMDLNNISNSLAAFMSSMRSYNSRYDQGYINNESLPFSNFTDLENKGKNLFFSTYNCGSCHAAGSQLINDWVSSRANIGLDPDGKGSGDSVGFKIPNLRNVEKTGPYMHDGRFATLEEVIEHYSNGIQMNQNLDWSFRETITVNGVSKTQAKKLNIPPDDKAALIAFLKTLTDYQYLNNRMFSNPFLP